MKKIFLPFIAIAIMTFFVACSNEDIITEEKGEPNVEGNILSLTASMPNDEPTTRVELEREGKNVNLTWVVYDQTTQTGDRIDLVFVKGTAMQRVVANVDSTSNDGKTAHFNIPIPSNATGSFTLYGVHGGRGTDPTEGNRNHALLPTNPGSTSTLASLQIPPQNRKMMLYFKHDMQATDTTASVSFQHLGSLFAISLRNSSSTPLTGFQELRLQGVGGGTDENWAYNSGAGGQIFDLITEEFQNKDSGGNFISYLLGSGATLASEQMTTLWAWYPPLPDKNWPALQLQLIDADGTTIVQQSVNSKPARTAPTPAGRAYHFYAVWDGTDLKFTNDDFTTPSPALPTD